MNKKRLAVVLIVCAALLGVGAYLLFSHNAKEGPEVRHAAAPPAEIPAKAPDWVNKGQTPEPDYAPAESAAHNATPAATAPAPLPEPKPQVVEIKEDRMVSFAFVDSLVDYVLAHYSPAAANGKPATSLCAAGLNRRFGRGLEGLGVEGDDILAMRATVLQYVFTPATIKGLAGMYGPFFVQELTDAARNDARDYRVGDAAENRVLTQAETVALLRLDAGVLERTATAFRTIADDPSLTDLAGKYLQAAKAVKRANARLQKALSDKEDVHEAGRRYKQAILQRESFKTAIVSHMRKACPTCPGGDVFYIAQWAYRRTLGDTAKLPVFAAAADGLDDLSARLLKASVDLESK